MNRSTSSGKSFVVLLLLILAAFGAYSHFTTKPAQQPEANNAQAKARPKAMAVVLYSGTDCEPCDRARTFLKQRGVRFDERNADRSPTAQRELEKLGSRIVPVIVVNGEPQYGFFEAHLDAALRGEPSGFSRP